MSSKTAVEHRRPVVLSGFILVLAAGLLYATELSRAAAVVVIPFALCLFAAVGYTYRSGRWPSRAWVVSFIIVAVLALAYAAWLYVYSLAHPPTSV